MKNKIGIIILGLAALTLSACGSFGDFEPTSSNGNGSSEVHVHTFEEGWTYDETNHWHRATCGHDVKDSEAPHEFELRDDLSTDYTTVEECSVCHYRKETVIPHHWESEWSTNETHHWHQCTDEGYEHLKKDYEEHNMQYDADASTEYLYVKKCSTCGYQTEVELEYSTDWSTTSEKHWHQCITEGYTHLKKDEANHTFELDTAKTTDYLCVEVCTVCGYEKSTEIVHNFDSNWSYNTTHHWHQCTDAGYEHLKQDYGEHTFDDDDRGGYIVHTCTVCGMSYNEIYAESPISSSRTMTTYYSTNSGTSSVDSTIYNMVAKDDVPYVVFKDFYLTHYIDFQWGYNNRQYFEFTQTKTATGVYQFQSRMGKVIIDANQDTISLPANTDPRVMLGVDMSNSGVSYLANGVERSYIHLDDNKSSLKANRGAINFNLGNYNIDIIVYDDVVYIPLATFNDIFIGANTLAFAYNGKDFFDCSSFGSSMWGDVSNTESLEYKFYNESPWKNASTRSAYLSEFTYNEYCFAMDNFYGLKDFRGVSSFDEFFTTNGYKTKLKSTNSNDYESEMMRFVAGWMFEGHSGFTRVSPFQVGTSYQNIYANNMLANEKYNLLYPAKTELTNYRNSAGKGVGLTMQGKTAIISFDSFKKGNFSSYTPDQYSYATWGNNDSEMLFRKAFGEITANSNIENVIIDVSLNGGGAVNALPWLYAYMTDDPYYTFRNKLTGEINECHYAVDLNRNGTFGDAGDTYKNDYNFFVLTSNYSFSCGNCFPTFVKEAGWATIIGERSGGGACAVSQLVTASGTMLRCSSIFQFVYQKNGGSYVLNEDGIDVDYSIARSNFYNDTYLDNFVRGL